MEEDEKRCTLPKSARCCQMEYAGDEACTHCGWQPEERARRKALPLTEDENGVRRKHVGKMAEIMQYFAVELDSFVNEYNGKHWDVDFVGTEYPPRIVMEQATPPLYKIEEDGKRTIEPNPTVQIIGRPDLQVITTGKLQISKKDLTKMVNGAANLLELFLHGFMQERKEMEAAQE